MAIPRDGKVVFWSGATGCVMLVEIGGALAPSRHSIVPMNSDGPGSVVTSRAWDPQGQEGKHEGEWEKVAATLRSTAAREGLHQTADAIPLHGGHLADG